MKPSFVKEAKVVWEPLLGFINFLLPGYMAASLLITCGLSFKSRGLSTPNSSSWVGVCFSSRVESLGPFL